MSRTASGRKTEKKKLLTLTLNLAFCNSYGTERNKREMFRSGITDVAATKYPRTPNDVLRRRRANTAKSENTASKLPMFLSSGVAMEEGGGGGGGGAAPPHFSQKNKDKKK